MWLEVVGYFQPLPAIGCQLSYFVAMLVNANVHNVPQSVSQRKMAAISRNWLEVRGL
jgi:hypothetical protein